MTNANDVIKELTKRGYKISAQTIIQNNIPKQAIVIKDANLTTEPRINLDNIVTNMPTASVNEIADTIIDIFNQHCAIDQSINKEFILNNIHIALRPKTNDSTIKQNTEYPEIEQYLCIYTRIGNGQAMTMKIVNATLAKNNITEKEAWNAAEKNNHDEAKIMSAQDLLKDDAKAAEDAKNIPIYIVTNNTQNYGAATVLDKKLLQESLPSNKFKKWKIIFTSIHRAALIPDNATPETNAMLETIKYFDKKNTRQKDRLTDKTFVLSF